MCTSAKAPPAPAPPAPPPAPAPLLEQDAPKTIETASDTQKKKKKGTKKYQTNALAINSTTPSAGVSVPT